MIPRHNLYRAILVPAIAASLFLGCSHTPAPPRVRVPPRMDLSRVGTLGFIEFNAGDRDGMGGIAAREFLASLQSAQPGTPVLELGDQRHVLSEMGRATLDTETVRALGKKYQVDALIVGSLDSQRVSPKVAFDATFATASAELEGALDARILDTRTGATVWSTASRARAEIAGVAISDRGVSSVGNNSPDDARRRLVTRLVRQATQDFWAHWE